MNSILIVLLLFLAVVNGTKDNKDDHNNSEDENIENELIAEMKAEDAGNSEKIINGGEDLKKPSKLAQVARAKVEKMHCGELEGSSPVAHKLCKDAVALVKVLAEQRFESTGEQAPLDWTTLNPYVAEYNRIGTETIELMRTKGHQHKQRGNGGSSVARSKRSPGYFTNTLNPDAWLMVRFTRKFLIRPWKDAKESARKIPKFVVRFAIFVLGIAPLAAVEIGIVYVQMFLVYGCYFFYKALKWVFSD